MWDVKWKLLNVYVWLEEGDVDEINEKKNQMKIELRSVAFSGWELSCDESFPHQRSRARLKVDAAPTPTSPQTLSSTWSYLQQNIARETYRIKLKSALPVYN